MNTNVYMHTSVVTHVHFKGILISIIKSSKSGFEAKYKVGAKNYGLSKLRIICADIKRVAQLEFG